MKRSISALSPSRFHLPVEVWVTLVFTSIWVFGLALGLPMNIPDQRHARLFNLHLVGPVLVGIGMQFLLTLLLSFSKYRKQREPNQFVMIKLFPILIYSLFLYFNFKGWMPFIQGRLYDQELLWTDQMLQPVLDLFFSVRHALANTFDLGRNHYNIFFIIVFFMAFGIHAVIDPPQRQREFVLGFCLNLLLGGISYWILPSVGPFPYRPEGDGNMLGSNNIMYELFLHVQATGEYPPGYFTAPLGAMPSLHVGHTVYMILCARRSFKPALLIYLPILFWITVEAVTLGWHYLLDLPAGALLAYCSFTLAKWLLRPKTQPKAVVTPGADPEQAAPLIPVPVLATADDYPVTDR